MTSEEGMDSSKRASVGLSFLVVNDWTTVSLGESSLVLIVGPNNSGKSQALRDLLGHSTTSGHRGLVVVQAGTVFNGTVEDLAEGMRHDGTVTSSPGGEETVAIGRGAQSLATVVTWWENDTARHSIANYFVLLADTESRLSASKPAPALDLYTKRPSLPVHFAYVNPSIEERLSTVSSQAFGSSLILDTYSGGSSWSFRVGSIDPPPTARPTQEYLEELRALPLLQDQGDGVRSLVGLLLTLFTGHHSIALIDEPEAFLHPPQARYLARLLSDDAAEGGQIFLSTHSADIVHGALEGAANTTVIRVRREGDVNPSAVIDNEAVRRLWADPLLRYSNLLEGLFSDGVIVCESDADCKFYNSVYDTITLVDDPSQRRFDLLFTSCGGKHRIRNAVSALKAASVPVCVVADFDVLNDWTVLSNLLESASGDPDDLKKDWMIVNATLSAISSRPSVVAVREAINKEFDEIHDTLFEHSHADRMRAHMKTESGWERAKTIGVAAVPPGDAYNACVRVLSRLKEHGIFLVPIGQMESFVPSVGNHGPTWVAEVLEQKLHEQSETDEARVFIGEAVAGLRLA